MQRTQLFGLLLGGLLAAVLLAPAPASAQCGADPTQTAIGIEVKSDAKGPSLEGVLIVEFLNSDGSSANGGARALTRLRRGGQLETLYAQVPGYGCSWDATFPCSRTNYACDWDTSITCQPSEYVCEWDPLHACDPSDPNACDHLPEFPPKRQCVENVATPCVDVRHPLGQCAGYTPCELEDPEATCEANLFDIGNPQNTQALLIEVLRGPALGAFFEDVCGDDGSLCPDPDVCGADGSLCPDKCGPDGSLCTPVDVVLKQLENFGVTDDLLYRLGDIGSQYMVTDVVMSATEPL